MRSLSRGPRCREALGVVWMVCGIGAAWAGAGSVPENLVVEGVPAFPTNLVAATSPYLEYRTGIFQDWHPVRREILILTRFGDTPQLHRVAFPGGAREQLTFLLEPVAGGFYQPRAGGYAVFSQDAGGGEFFQLYRLGLLDGRVTLLTDGRSRNMGPVPSRDGRWVAYTSTRRNGRDTDVYVIDPAQPATDRRVTELSGGGWSVQDWSPDARELLLQEYLSINESRLWIVDAAGGQRRQITPAGEKQVAYGGAQFDPAGKGIYVTTDRGSEFLRLTRLNPADGGVSPVLPGSEGDVDAFDVSPDGRRIALVVNEDGVSRLRVVEARTGKELKRPALPMGVIPGVKWHPQGRQVGFTLSSARSPGDTYSLDPSSGRVDRWTMSETGGLDPTRFVEPELVRMRSFDGLTVSAFVYRPDPRRFPGPRPVLVNIHGGPEAQARPGFLARNNYYLDELGIALVYPNVRGSRGYGKTFVTLDNGIRREDSVRDIGAVLDWIAGDRGLDASRVGVMGGSYGGYMVLASLIHFGDRLRCGVDVVGISSFLTFLKNTQEYRRDLRRAEYGDERDPEVRAVLERIAPLGRAAEIRRPLFVVQGYNDPRVPVSEAEQMVRAIRAQGGVVWYLMARDEGHGFAKKPNADFQFLATVMFLREYLLGDAAVPVPRSGTAP